MTEQLTRTATGSEEVERRPALLLADKPQVVGRPDARTARRFPARPTSPALGEDPLCYKDAVN
jgi:hypothetical protein